MCCISTAGTSNSALPVPPTSTTFVYCIPTSGIGDAGTAPFRDARLPNQNAKPVSAIAPTAPTAAPAIQGCGVLLLGVDVIDGRIATEDVKELDEVVDDIGAAPEKVGGLEGMRTSGNVIVGPAKGAEDVLE